MANYFIRKRFCQYDLFLIAARCFHVSINEPKYPKKRVIHNHHFTQNLDSGIQIYIFLHTYNRKGHDCTKRAARLASHVLGFAGRRARRLGLIIASSSDNLSPPIFCLDVRCKYYIYTHSPIFVLHHCTMKPRVRRAPMHFCSRFACFFFSELLMLQRVLIIETREFSFVDLCVFNLVGNILSGPLFSSPCTNYTYT